VFSIINSTRTIDSDIMGVKRGDQFWECAITSDFAEVTFGFEYARGGPA
jgi:hypothetical protein